MSNLNFVGKSETRIEGLAKLNGKAIYPQDVKIEGMLHAVTVRSSVSHANFTIKDKQAKKIKGVKVLTHKDVSGKNEHGVLFKDHQVFASKKVRRIGDPIALVVAESISKAKEAASKIEIIYNELPAVFSPIYGMEDSSPRIHDEKSNVITSLKMEKGKIDFSKCDYVVENLYETPMVDHAFLQPECSVAYMNNKKLVVITSTQYPHWDRYEISNALGIQEKEVQVINATIGGAFGGREDITSQIHAALAAYILKKPVRILYGREESFLAHSKRHPMIIKTKLGALKNGKIIAMQNDIIADSGAYASWAPNVLRKAMVHSTGPYEIENVNVTAKSVYTNNPFTGAMRGFGATQVAVAYEQIIEQLAVKMELNSFEIREKNILRVGSKTGTSQLIHASAPLGKCLELVKKNMAIIRQKPVSETALTGYGIALSFYGTGYGNGFPDVSNNLAKLNKDGGIEIFSGFTEVGQGAKTVMAQIAGEVFNTSSKNIVVHCEDTDNTPDTGTAAASRQTYNTGNAVMKSCKKLRSLIFKHAANDLGLNNDIGLNIEDGVIYLKTLPSKRISLKEIVTNHNELICEASFTAQTTELDEFGQGAPYWPYGFNAIGVKVEIDPESGKTSVVDGVFAQDVGKAINPRFIGGQMDGGFSMGLGYALYEDLGLREGVMENKKFSSYILPTAKDIPNLKKIIVEDPEETGPYGAKGIGKIVTIPVAPAILNAIYDASKIRFTKLPVTPIELMKEFKKND